MAIAVSVQGLGREHGMPLTAVITRVWWESCLLLPVGHAPGLTECSGSPGKSWAVPAPVRSNTPHPAESHHLALETIECGSPIPLTQSLTLFMLL